MEEEQPRYEDNQTPFRKTQKGGFSMRESRQKQSRGRVGVKERESSFLNTNDSQGRPDFKISTNQDRDHQQQRLL